VPAMRAPGRCVETTSIGPNLASTSASAPFNEAGRQPVSVDAERADGNATGDDGVNDGADSGVNDGADGGVNDAYRARDGCRDCATGLTGPTGSGAVKLVDPERLAFRGSETARDAPKRANEVPTNEATSAAKILTRQ
jgi:hypothetical protein